MGGIKRGPYRFLCPPHSQIHPYQGMAVQVIADNCMPIEADFTSTSKLTAGDVQIGAIQDNVSIIFKNKDTIEIGINTVKNVIINTQKAIINADETEVNGNNISLNVAEITSTANITTTGNITGALITGTSDVIAGGISGKNHTHKTNAPFGSNTNSPNP
jgi:hypothetical protein